MLSRRQKAILELLVTVAALATALFTRGQLVERSDDGGEWSVRLVLIGALTGVVHRALHDRNVFGVRESRLRRGVFSGAWTFGTNKILPSDELSGLDFSIGTSLGSIAYRLWYGVLRPLPE